MKETFIEIGILLAPCVVAFFAWVYTCAYVVPFLKRFKYFYFYAPKENRLIIDVLFSMKENFLSDFRCSISGDPEEELFQSSVNFAAKAPAIKHLIYNGKTPKFVACMCILNVIETKLKDDNDFTSRGVPGVTSKRDITHYERILNYMLKQEVISEEQYKTMQGKLRVLVDSLGD